MGTHAVVLGGSIAGCCAARVLADHVDRVTVVERDVLPDGPEVRRGAPQGRHVHALLVRGRRELDRLFPGFQAAMRAGGALELDFLRDFATLRPGGWWAPQRSGLVSLFASRALIEHVVRTLLRADPRVAWREATSVVGLEADAARTRVHGVRVAPRDAAGEVLDADLVVDATGRASRAPEWLRALGLEPPAETVVDAHVAYATRWYEAPAERMPGQWWHGLWIDPADPTRDMAGVLSPVEGSRWVVTAAGGPGCHPGTDPEAFAAALRGLRSPAIAEAVAHARPLTPVYGNRETANRFRHYDRWPVRLGGFLAVGDAACKFNPVYGQGITTATLAAGALEEQLRRATVTDPSLPMRTFRAQARVLAGAWSMATGADFRFAGAEGRRPPFAGLMRRYMDRLFTTSADEPMVRETLGEVIHMLRAPGALVAPGTVLRVLARSLRGGPPAGFSAEMPVAAPHADPRAA